MIHQIKCWVDYFQKLESGEKTFEVRLNDRDYQVGDTVIINEYDNSIKKYTGKYKKVKISYILKDYPALLPNFIVFSWK